MSKSSLNLLTALTLTLGSQLHTMEAQNTDWWSRLKSRISRKKKPTYEPEKIKLLRAKSRALKISLAINQETLVCMYLYPSPQLLEAEIDFVRYIAFTYYQIYRQLQESPQSKLLSEKILTKCQNARINGYSALGAIVTTDIHTHPDPSLYVQWLLDLGFQPTEKDRELAYLELYERTLLDSTRKALLWLVCSEHPKNTSGLPQLPLGIIKHIATFITEEKTLFEYK